MTVYLVGAGPGDPGLFTVRGAEVLSRADVVVYDRLIPPSLLAMAPGTALRIDVGKSPGSPVAQDDINAILVEYGAAGQEVVRLKGGDPFVFGRGGEEASALLDAGVAFEVVPGVSSALAAPAYAGIPVTHRGLSTSFTVVTGHSRHSVDTDTDWAALARAGDTILVLMGVAHRHDIAARLMHGGLPGATPVAAVRWGTDPRQRTVRTTLAELGHVALEPPVTIVIGRVAALDLRWFEARPLFGRRVVVTRSPEQISGLAHRLRQAGAEVVEMSTIAISDPVDGGGALREAASAVREFAWVCFTSTNAVARFFDCLRDSRALGDVKVAVVGPTTAAALVDRGVVADLEPTRATAQALVEAFPIAPERVGGASLRRVLLPQAAAASTVLASGLADKGWPLRVVHAYRTVRAEPTPDALAAATTADAVVFTSSSTVTNYLAAAGSTAVPPVVACIGPVTAATAERAGLEVSAVATPHTVAALVDTLVAHFARRAAGG